MYDVMMYMCVFNLFLFLSCESLGVPKCSISLWKCMIFCVAAMWIFLILFFRKGRVFIFLISLVLPMKCCLYTSSITTSPASSASWTCVSGPVLFSITPAGSDSHTVPCFMKLVIAFMMIYHSFVTVAVSIATVLTASLIRPLTIHTQSQNQILCMCSLCNYRGTLQFKSLTSWLLMAQLSIVKD